MKFTEEHLEQAIIELLGKENIYHIHGETLPRSYEDVLIQLDCAGSQALLGNPVPEALLPVTCRRSRASPTAFPSGAWERVKSTPYRP